jgi:hypothetical protein
VTPERVAVSGADLRSLTGAELFAGLARARLTRARLALALAALQDPDGDPDLGLAGFRFLQAVALELALRGRPEVPPTWEDAQRWDVVADLSEGEDPLEVDRREYRVAAAVATGLDPEEAMAAPVLEVEEFARRRAG